MAKKGFGKVLAVANVAGAAAAGISYLKKYRSFNKELEEEFHDFEGEDDEDLEDLFFEDEEEDAADALSLDTDEEEDTTADTDKEEGSAQSKNTRRYIALNASTDELKLAAKDMLAAAGGMAGAARNVLKDAAAILTDTAHEAASAAKDTAQAAKAKVAEKVEERKERKHADVDEEEDIFEDETPVDVPAAGEDGDGHAPAQDAPEESATAATEPAAKETGATDTQDAAPAPEKEDKASAADPQEAPSTTEVVELE